MWFGWPRRLRHAAIGQALGVTAPAATVASAPRQVTILRGEINTLNGALIISTMLLPVDLYGNAPYLLAVFNRVLEVILMLINRVHPSLLGCLSL